MKVLKEIIHFIFYIVYISYVICAIGVSDIIMTISFPVLLISRRTFRKITNGIANFGWPLITIAFEWLGKNKLVWTSEQSIEEILSNSEKTNALVLINHTYHCDWLISFSFGERLKRIGNIKIAMKNVIKYIPLVGVGIWAMGFIFLSRKWQNDQKKISKAYQHLVDEKEPFWFVTHPEGSRFNKVNLEKSQTFSRERGLPILNNIILPRVKGFTSAVIALKGNLDYIYDLTVAYKKRPSTFFALFYGSNPAEIHVHVRKIPISELPINTNNEKDIDDWLYNLYKEKDQLLQQFKEKGYFPHTKRNLDFKFENYYFHLFTWLIGIIFTILSLILLFNFLFKI